MKGYIISTGVTAGPGSLLSRCWYGWHWTED